MYFKLHIYTKYWKYFHDIEYLKMLLLFFKLLFLFINYNTTKTYNIRVQVLKNNTDNLSRLIYLEKTHVHPISRLTDV